MEIKKTIVSMAIMSMIFAVSSVITVFADCPEQYKDYTSAYQKHLTERKAICNNLEIIASNLENKNKVTSINVGAGDCTLISSTNENNEIEHMLIDTGDSNWGNIKKCLEENRVERFKYVVITHPHEDHYVNFRNISRDYEIENLIIGEGFKSKDLYCYCNKTERIQEDRKGKNRIINLIKNNKKLMHWKYEEIYGLGKGKFKILRSKPKNEFEECKNEAKTFYPVKEQFNLCEINDYNNFKNTIENLKIYQEKLKTQLADSDSIVIKLELGNKSFLFCGDCRIWNLKALTENYRDELKKDELKADYLKLPHHGRKSITEDSYHKDEKQLEERKKDYQDFIDKVDPKYAIISDSKYNTPEDEKHFKKFRENAVIYCTCNENIKGGIFEIYNPLEEKNNSSSGENIELKY